MPPTSHPSTAVLWARFRFSVVGPLLSSPPAHGEIKVAIRALAAKTWTHPIHGRAVRFAAGTIERWYYTARREKDDPVGVLRRAVRKDRGKVSLTVRRQLPVPFSDNCFSPVSSVGRRPARPFIGLARTRERKPGSFSQKITHLNPALDQEFRALRFLLFWSSSPLPGGSWGCSTPGSRCDAPDGRSPLRWSWGP